MINPEITLAEVKQHLAINHTVNDYYISSLIPTAITNVEDTIDRSLDDVKCINEKGELKAPLRQAILLMIGSLYDYRGSQQAEQIYDNPAFERLISKYRRMGV